MTDLIQCGETSKDIEIRHFHFCSGIAGAAKGFNQAADSYRGLNAHFRCIGGVDVDPDAVRFFTRESGVQGTLLDLFDREQYISFHGQNPPKEWREATIADIHRAAHYERPHVVFISAPCKGFSGLLAQSKSLTPRYQALNRLTLRCVWLMCEAWGDDPPEFIAFENVPRILSRGQALLGQIRALLARYGYAVVTPNNYVHNCGELGGLAQNRLRFFLMARHMGKIPPHLYEPDRHPLRAVGDILGAMPMPNDPRGGPMHTMPHLQWKTWVRLAFVEAGADWRSLNRLKVVDGKLADYLLVPVGRNDLYGVNAWDHPAGTVTGDARPAKGSFSVADPRSPEYSPGYCGVGEWDKTAHTVSGRATPTNGFFAVADPRHHGPAKFNHCYRIVRFDEAAQAISGGGGKEQCVADPRFPNSQGEHGTKYHVQPWSDPSDTVTGSDRIGSGALCVADPRMDHRRGGVLGVKDWDESSGTIAGESLPPNGAFAVADPRPDWEKRRNNLRVEDWSDPASTIIGGGKGVQGGWLSVADPRLGLQREKGDNYLTAGHYGVTPWNEPTGAVSGAASADNGRWSVADPRLPEPNDNGDFVIISPDNTRHRPFTTLELAALQSFVTPEQCWGQPWDLDGISDSKKREFIGNAVPPASARAMATAMARALLMARSGETFALSAMPIWVQPFALALTLEIPKETTHD